MISIYLGYDLGGISVGLCSFSMLRRMNTRHGEMVLAARGLQDQFLQVPHEDGVKTCFARTWPVPSSLAKMNAEARARSATG